MLLVGRDIEESNNMDTLSWRTVRWDIYKDMILEELQDDIKEDTERCVWSSILSTLLFEVCLVR